MPSEIDWIRENTVGSLVGFSIEITGHPVRHGIPDRRKKSQNQPITFALSPTAFTNAFFPLVADRSTDVDTRPWLNASPPSVITLDPMLAMYAILTSSSTRRNISVVGDSYRAERCESFDEKCRFVTQQHHDRGTGMRSRFPYFFTHLHVIGNVTSTPVVEPQRWLL